MGVINIPPESICYIEKNTVIDVTLNVLGKGMPYDIFHIDNNILSCICKVMEPLLLNPIKLALCEVEFLIAWRIRQIQKYLK